MRAEPTRIVRATWAIRLATIITVLGAIASAPAGQLGTPVPAASEPPRRVVSTNLCADQLLLAIADPLQIASLGPFSDDPELSFLADRAKAFPHNRGTGENVVRLEADLVLVGPYDSASTRALLAAKKVELLSLAPWTSLDQGRSQIRILATLLCHPERGEALIAAIDQALEQVKGTAPPGRSALVMHRRGYVPGRGTITAEIASVAGLQDAARSMGLESDSFVTLERLTAQPPDYLILSEADQSAVDNGSALLVHPALMRLVPPERRLFVPDRLTICGGPSTPALIERIAREIAAKVR
jgi:iron complex transport system substrate-binding protein